MRKVKYWIHQTPIILWNIFVFVIKSRMFQKVVEIMRSKNYNDIPHFPMKI